ncbi:MAG TPA: RHS repeat-associated core domain-containing protein, partial [Allosphingosinicella sp.]|nr:RHS repeat-associated core domain-containing protein [Allosphingosinicella sp.]
TLIAEYGSTGALLRRFVHGPGIDEPLVWYEGPGLTVRRFLHADERGSIVAISDSAGTVIGTNRYDEYGVPQGAVAGRFHYTGQPWIASLGLYYYRARFYHPHLGRFMQPDPIGYGGGMNMYAYVRGDPVNLRDPSGLNPGYREDFSAPECIGADICVTGTGWSKQVGLDLARGLLINALGGGTGSSTGEAAAAEEETIVVTGTRSPPGPPPRRPLPVPPPPPAFVLAAAREPTNWCTWSPESVGGIDVSEACRQHDNCLGSPIRRSTCDQQFGAAVYIECRRQGGDAATCLVIAAAYRSGVWIGTLLGV